MRTLQLNKALKAIENIRTIITDEQALNVIYLYPSWHPDGEYELGDRVRYHDVLYKCITAHKAQEIWTPEYAASLWAKVLIPDPEIIPEWEQPLSTNLYMLGDKVTHNGKTWESITDNNSWEPGIYGWKEVSS